MSDEENELESEWWTQGWIDLGSGIALKFFTCQHVDLEKPTGGIMRYDVRNRDSIFGGVSWCSECDGATWKLISLDPLTIEPSIQNKEEPRFHGFITNGKWIPC